MDVNKLFRNAVKGNWEDVIEAYKSNPMAPEAKITRSEDTALHLAVSDGQTHIVSKLVEIIGKNSSSILSMKNERGNTAVHLAAALGNVDMCKCLASKDEKLITDRNVEGETPLFLAALHGKKMAFLCLHFLYHGADNSICVRNNGDTILHAAISGEYFNLAYQIICCYPTLVNSVNHKGKSPLHILASKPNAFKSSSRLGIYDRIIYRCMIVDELKDETQAHAVYFNRLEKKSSTKFKSWLSSTGKMLEITTRRKNNGIKKNHTDEENPQQKSTRSQGTSKTKFQFKYTIIIVQFSRLMIKALLAILGVGIWRMNKIKEMKGGHRWAVEVMDKLLDKHSREDKYDDNERNPTNRQHPPDSEFKETPILIAAKMGVAEMVEKILDTFPEAIYDLDSEKKNVVLLAAENRHTFVYNLLLSKKILKESVFRQLDNQGNSALHLAAMFGVSEYRPWHIPGAALQMQWEYKWYKFVRDSMPSQFFVRCNDKGQTAMEIFRDTHKDLVKDSSEWLTKTSESCSLLAALIATVAFATTATLPGGTNEGGAPNFLGKLAFDIFTIASFVALCSSVTALVFFLSFLTYRYQEIDFATELPRKLLVGLTMLFTSIASMIISFFASHVFILREKLKHTAFPIYAVICLPLTFFVLTQLPIYLDLIWAIFVKVPQRSYNVLLH